MARRRASPFGSAEVVSRGYPGPHLRVLDDRFEDLVIPSEPLVRVATGFSWAEGPVWFGDHDRLVFSDIPNDRMLAWDRRTDTVTPFRTPSGFANGGARDHVGRLITCEHGGRRVTRTEHDGTVTVVADAFDGAPLNSPNDVIALRDGSIVFTDPRFGILSDFQGTRADPELPSAVYSVAHGGEIAPLSLEFEDPNGLALSADGERLYVVESTGSPGVYEVPLGPAGRAGPRRLLRAADGGEFDGLRLDVDGRLWCAWSDRSGQEHGVRVLAPDGRELGRISVPEPCTNLTFGGRLRTSLLITSVWSLFTLKVAARGLR